jgi:hypothetical protein
MPKTGAAKTNGNEWFECLTRLIMGAEKIMSTIIKTIRKVMD